MKKGSYAAPTAVRLFQEDEYPACDILLVSEDGPVDEWTENEK